MAKQRLNKDQDSEVYAGGTLGANNGAEYKDLNEQFNRGITKTDSKTYTVVTAGMYFMHFQQLINSAAGSPYLMIRINGVTVKQAWQTGSHMEDMVVSDLRQLAVGDTIKLYQSLAVTNSWGAEHSSYQIILIRRSS